MSSVLHFRDVKTLVWPLANVPQRLETTQRGDEWASDPCEFVHETADRFCFHVALTPVDDEGNCSLSIHVTEAPKDVRLDTVCDAWIEKIDGQRSKRKRSICELKETFAGGWPSFCTAADWADFKATPTLFVCVEMPFDVHQLGSALPTASTHRWTIPSLQKCLNATKFGAQRKSDKFRADGLDGAEFFLEWFPKHHAEECKGNSALYLFASDLGDRSALPLQYELWFENAEGRRLRKLVFNFTLHKDEDRELDERRDNWGRNELSGTAVLRAFTNGGGPLTICCQLRPIGAAAALSDERLRWIQVARTFNNRFCADATIYAAGRTFFVYTWLLSMHSPVFAAHFKPKLEGDERHSLTVETADAEAVERMLRFVYTGEVDDLPAFAARLLPLAGQFKLQDLEKQCLEWTAKNLTVDNVMPLLVWTFEHQHEQAAAEFKPAVLQFAVENRKRFVRRPEWNDFKQQHADIVIAIFES